MSSFKYLSKGEKVYWIGMLIIFALLILTTVGCGTTKTVTKSEVKEKEQIKTNAVTNTTTNIEKKTFGDTLKGENFIPASALTDTPATQEDTTDIHAKGNGTVPKKKFKKHQPYSVTGESQGIKYRQTFIPQFNNGKFTGVMQNFSIIAKPVTTTDTREAQHSDVSTTIKKDSAGKADSKTTSKKGLALPSWVWWVIVIAVLVVLAYIFLKSFIIEKLKQWIL